MGGFDEMAWPCGTHLSAYTKAAIGWLDRGAITAQNGRSARHELHSGRPDPAAAVGALGGADRHERAVLDGRGASESTSSTQWIPSEVRSSTGCRRLIRWATPRTARLRWIC